LYVYRIWKRLKKMNDIDKKDQKKMSSSSKTPNNKPKDRSDSNSGKRDQTASGKRANEASGKRAEEASGIRASGDQNTTSGTEEDAKMMAGYWRRMREGSEQFSKPIIPASILEQSQKFQQEHQELEDLTSAGELIPVFTESSSDEEMKIKRAKAGKAPKVVAAIIKAQNEAILLKKSLILAQQEAENAKKEINDLRKTREIELKAAGKLVDKDTANTATIERLTQEKASIDLHLCMEVNKLQFALDEKIKETKNSYTLQRKTRNRKQKEEEKRRKTL
jgi:hypothetical protein